MFWTLVWIAIEIKYDRRYVAYLHGYPLLFISLSSYLLPYVAYVLVYHVAPYLLRIPLRTRRDPSKRREYIDIRGKYLQASSFPQETIILEDMTKFNKTFLHGE